MKTRHSPLLWLAIAVLVVTLLPLPAALAHGGGGHGSQSGASRYFDSSRILIVSGVLADPGGDWRLWGHGNHTGGGTHFELRSDDGTEFDLMLAPDWFLADTGMVLAAGDRVTVTGSVVAPYVDQPWHQNSGSGHGHGGQGRTDTHDFLIVTVLEAGGTMLVLRDDEGYPVWRGGPGGGITPWFDPDALVEVRGTLLRELGFWGPWGHGNQTGGGMHYLFESATGEVFYAILGPYWYLEDQGLVLEPGMTVDVIGSVVEPYWEPYSDHRFLVAAEIVAGTQTAVLRDEFGFPLWHGTGWHYYAPPYDQSAEIHLSGRVQRTQTRPYGQSLDRGYEMIVWSGDRRFLVFVAPAWHVETRHFAVRGGEWVEMRGTLVRDFQDRLTFVAGRVTVDGQIWRFRNLRGNPVWIHGAP